MMYKRYITILLLLLCTGYITNAQQKKGRSPKKEIIVPEGLTYEVLTYRESTPKRATQMAVSYRDDGIKDKPVIVFIHGGGWAKGDKDDVMYQVFNVAKRGFVGVSISYRLISEAPFPACIEDVKQAIRFLKSKEGELPIDVTRIGIWGYSAGAHLALMIGLSPDELFKTDEYSAYNTNVKAIMAVSAPTDFVTRREKQGALAFFTEEQNNSELFQENVSPLSFIHQNQPSIYMLHGTADPLVKPFHYKNFEAACKEKGVDNFELFEFEERGHMFYFKRNKETKPAFNAFLQEVKETVQ
ncbi:alpha/beta hydrolase [Flammeovirga kamogawensis]|uniref:Alpha/beta hydrolase n=1 Tax=Flammeovirga kamogawensis TaxID=373891 RepID=A0ABX8H3S4_9BACT|nr:alpha/beta hydrolase [Flammeovirga kamogawensis]MBB6460503.1 acetyl esterase/lipase [Flammeovirga kamogawensis]QWG10309.1 alpha/beta hydrolase [Flammeovirga kamogawensis]TRX64757.1 alpha/beta hydrolase [Flammeovirga kamogawensis]